MLEKNGSRYRPGKEVSQKPNGKLKWGLNRTKTAKQRDSGITKLKMI